MLQRCQQLATFALWLLCASTAGAETLRVEVLGVDKELANNVRLSLDWKDLNVSELSQAYLQQRLTASEVLALKALEPFGYYNASVKSDLRRESRWIARYSINPGPLTQVTELSLTFDGHAQNDPAFASSKNQFPLQPGQAFVHGSYEAGKSAISTKLANSGYLDAKLKTAKVSVSRSTNSARIQLHWSSGKRYRFGALSSNSGEIDPRLIQRWAQFSPGEPFDYERLLAFQQSLDSSGFFSFSEVSIDADRETGIANVSASTEPAAKRQYRLSLGYGTDTGARAQLGFEQRWLNRFGHSLRAGTRLAEREQSYSISYQVPALRGRAESYHYGWQRRSQQLPEYDTRSDRLSAVQLSKTRHWSIQWGLNVERDSFTIADQEQSETLWYLENQWSRFKSNKPVYPNYVNSLLINARLGTGFDDQQKYFSRVYVQNLWIRPAPWPGRVILRAAAGALWSDTFDKLPPHHRFFSGGDRNVRGYAYQSLSPTNAANARIGGRFLAEASAEFDYRLADSWAVALFTDAGQAFSDEQPEFAIGTGLGLRFITSVLVVRLDVANAITADDQPWRLHLTLGTDF